MSYKDSFFFFMDGLDTWAKIVLRHRGVQDLSTIIAVVETLINYSKDTSRSKNERIVPGVDKEKCVAYEDSSRKPSKGKDGRRDVKPKSICYFCDGPHWMTKCPKRKATINGIRTKTLVDTGAFHIFISVEDVQRLNIKNWRELPLKQ